MVKTIERVHGHTRCPQCKTEVAGHHRFCRVCTFWLARPENHGIRSIDPPSRALRWSGRIWSLLEWFRPFRTSISFVVIGLSVGVLGMMALFTMWAFTPPDWIGLGSLARRQVCHANMRVIQGAMEIYLQDNRFTPALASDPVGVLMESGLLLSRPRCPVEGNVYRIPRGSGLQCVGPEGHGRPR